MHRLLTCFLFYLAANLPVSSFSQADTVSKKALITSCRHEFSVSYGSYTPDFLMDGYRPGRPTEFDYANKGLPGAVCVNYKFALAPRSFIGLTATIEQQHGDWLDNEIPGGNVFDLQTTVKGAFIRTSYTLGADYTYDYLVAGIFREYLVVGLGVTWQNETDPYFPDFYNQGYYNGVNSYGPMRAQRIRTHLNGYFAPFGFKVGRRLCYFMELGFGYKGIINTGISYGIGNLSSKK